MTNERDGGLDNFLRIAPRGSHAPSTVMNRLKETYPETAKEFAAAFQLNR